MSLDLALSVARSGLRLLDLQMARTADDIANAGTDGHTRKTLAGEALSAAGSGIGVRAQVPAFGAADLVALELHLMQRAAGMRIETPAVRP